MQKPWRVCGQSLGKWLTLGAISTLLALAGQSPVVAARRVAVRAGIFARSLPVADLRQYAETGQATPELRALLRRLDAEERQSFQQILKVQLPVNVLTVDRFLSTPPGQKILADIADITIREDQAGIPAARGALILATARPGGLGVLNFLEAYPSRTITLSLSETLAFLRENQALLLQVGGLLRPAPGGQAVPPSAP